MATDEVPTDKQLLTLDSWGMVDPGARVIGWHHPTKGPLVRRSNGDFMSVYPDGARRVLARSTDKMFLPVT